MTLLDTLNDFAKNVTDYTSGQFELTKLYARISGLKSVIKEAEEKLGKIYYEQLSENADDIPEEAKAHFDCVFPKSEIYFEHMLVNHMFFSQFPFQDRPESMHSEFVALCAVYAIMRFLGTGCMAEQRNKNALIDGMASTFRLIDHTEFDRYASCLLVKLNCSTKEQLYDLVSL